MNIVFIPVRCGSKSIRLKNIKDFNGKPLVFWTALAAQDANYVDKIIIATDCKEIEKVISDFGFSKVELYWRNQENSKDTSSTEDVMLEYIYYADLNDTDRFILIQATSPFIKSKEIDAAISLMSKNKYDSILSVVKQKRFIWNKYGKPLNYDYKYRPRRQDFEGYFLENGAIYINSVANIKKTKNRLSGRIGIFEMPFYTSVELDEESDWIFAEYLNQKFNILSEINIPEIKLFLSDIDGVLTDSGMYYSENGDELKKFSTYDGMAFKMLRESGILTGLITSEELKLNKRRANKVKVDYIFQGVTNKLSVVKDLCKELSINIREVAYIGDDINDYNLLKEVGLAACPQNAIQIIKDITNIIHLSKEGGNGAVREFVEKILNK